MIKNIPVVSAVHKMSRTFFKYSTGPPVVKWHVMESLETHPRAEQTAANIIRLDYKLLPLCYFKLFNC